MLQLHPLLSSDSTKVTAYDVVESLRTTEEMASNAVDVAGVAETEPVMGAVWLGLPCSA